MGVIGKLRAGCLCVAILWSGPSVAETDIRGLWVGEAIVSHVQSPNGVHQPSPAPLSFKLIVNVGQDGALSLVNQAVVVRSPDGSLVLTGREITRGRLSALSDAALLGAEKFGTVGYDMDGGQAPLSGAFGDNATMQTTLTVGPTSDANPFRHRFHPDHDNLSEAGSPLQDDGEVYAVSRNMAFEFDPELAGERRVGGRFSEVITGLRAKPVEVSGLFVLEQVHLLGGSEE